MTVENTEIKQTTNIDHYANVCRDWRIEKLWGEQKDLLVVHSGTDGINIATKSSNNGFIQLKEDEVKKLIKELTNSIDFSREAKKTMNEYWDRKNGVYGLLKKIKAKFK